MTDPDFSPAASLVSCHMRQGQIDHDGALHLSASTKLLHYRSVYANCPDTIAFMPIAVSTLGRLYPDFIRIPFLHAHREASALAIDLPEVSDHFRFMHAACFANLKGSVGLTLAKASALRVSIPIDLSSPLMPPTRFLRSRRPLLRDPSLILFLPPPPSAQVAFDASLLLRS